LSAEDEARAGELQLRAEKKEGKTAEQMTEKKEL
jgi:hypothetical protein